MRRWAIVLLVTGAASAWAGEPRAARFTKRALMIDSNEGCTIADVNRDGKPDVVAGRCWYAAPDFVPRPLRLIDDWRSYAQTNGDHVCDVDGDGWLDVIGGYWCLPEVHWFRNPGAVELSRGRLWPKHVLGNVGGKTNEFQVLRDLDGDGVPEWVVNDWNKNAPLRAWRLTKDAKGQPTLKPAVIGSKGNGHGMGFGDLNGDGREDILVGVGWYERPEGDPFAREWTLHRDWDHHASCPMVVTDLDGDGRSDVLWGNSHGFGLYWKQQLAPAADGRLQWRDRLIDRSWSQPHFLLWEDLDGDGQPDLITGKRVRAHDGKDPGGKQPPCLYYYTWDKAAKQFIRHTIDEGTLGIGMQIAAGDLNGDGRLDLVVAGKAGTCILLNEGNQPAAR